MKVSSQILKGSANRFFIVVTGGGITNLLYLVQAEGDVSLQRVLLRIYGLNTEVRYKPRGKFNVVEASFSGPKTMRCFHCR